MQIINVLSKNKKLNYWNNCVVLFILFCFFGVKSFSQIPKSLDSLKVFLKTNPQDTNYVFALNEYAFLIVKEGKYDEAEKVIKQMESLTTKLDFGAGYCKVANMRGVVAYSQQKPQEAMEYFMKSNELIKKYKLPKTFLQNSLNNITIIYNQLGDRDNATKYAMQLIDFQEKNKLEPLKTNPYGQIGDNLKFYKKYDEALKYFQKTLDIETRYQNYTGMAIAENNIGNVYDDLKKNKEAIKHYQIGLKYAEKENYKLLQTDFLTNLGRMYQEEKDFIQAEKYLRKSESFSRELDAIGSLKTVCHNLGDLYYFQEKYGQAEKCYLEALSISKKMEDFEYMYVANQALAELYETTEDFKKAYFYKVEAESAKDSTFKIETAQNTDELLKKYETSKKEQEIALLNEKNEKARLQNKSLITGGVLLFLLTGISAILFVNRNKLKRLEESQKLRNRIAADLHDEIGSTLSSILLISGMAKKQNSGENSEKNNKMFTKIHADSQHVMESVDEIIWSISPVNDSLQDILLRLREYAQPLAESKSIAFEFKSDETLEKLTLPMETRRNLYLIVKEAINNLIKYSEASKASIYFAQDKKNVIITIKDNGKGFDPTAITSRNGLKNMQIRAKEIQANITIDSSPENGSEIKLSFLVA